MLHTKLDIRFDWQIQQVIGKAYLTLKPYFYPEDTLVLDAKSFEFREISHITGTGNEPLKYEYKNNGVYIALGKDYNRTDTIRLYIDYIAIPSKQGGQGSWAISDSKGLYFINADGSEKDKPKQIWTQGETENSSCWFPTIDAPNERMTQEIYLTVDTGFVTLSNGLLVYSKDNGDGTRTDYWKQSVPHAPYLAMIAIGNYSIVKDNWRGMEVSYYVEPEYENYARKIFGNTPEMIEYFSNRIGIPFPWEKYAQVTVREFVSGAMENSSATVHGEFVQRNDRELLDETYEDYISHELFHQWFGDLVTCESWANLPLNESFATYGEYLWREYKYGRDDADQHLDEDLANYLREARRKKVDMIRYDYSDKEDMFDSHSYSKGGRILHMLRNYLGDEAFFSALKLYLETHKFSSVEIHDLRLAFEKITGEDLNWFFNQWFLAKGHPELAISYAYDDSMKTVSVIIGQLQDTKKFPAYRLPIDIDIYAGGKTERHKVVIEDVISSFSFKVVRKPDLVNFDAEKILLCVKLDLKTDDQWIFQYYNAPLYADRSEALDHFSNGERNIPADLFIDALNDKNHDLRIRAIESMNKIYPEKKNTVVAKLTDLALHDENANVRATAVQALSDLSVTAEEPMTDDEKSNLEKVFKTALNDRSYSVTGEALASVARLNPSIAVNITKPFEDETNENILLAVARIYSNYGTVEQAEFFRNKIATLSDHKKTYLLQEYAAYLLNQDDETINKGLPLLEEFARNEKIWWRRMKGIEMIEDVYDEYERRETEMTGKLGKSGKSSPEHENLKKHLEAIKQQKDHVRSLLTSIMNDEKDPRVKMISRNN